VFARPPETDIRPGEHRVGIPHRDAIDQGGLGDGRGKNVIMTAGDAVIHHRIFARGAHKDCARGQGYAANRDGLFNQFDSAYVALKQIGWPAINQLITINKH